jgi:CDP-4-dehydro-6-deoxyglucose reductase, E1
MTPRELKREILSLVRRYHQEAHAKPHFVPGKTRITYAGRVYDDAELVNLVDSSLEFWLTAGPYAAELEARLRRLFGAERALLVNSGSSANLVMMSALRSRQFGRALEEGDEVITPSVTFPTTLTPILQNQLVPVFVDCELGTYNIDPRRIEDAIGPRTRAIFVPHTLGNPCDLAVIGKVAEKHSLIVLEDACDAFGAEYDGRMVGTFGVMASLSFYPAHHITMGEGGAVIVNDPQFSRIAVSLRDWGRDCWCDPGSNDTCGGRFTGQYGDLPAGYDHKYVYSNLGYNLKVTDMQAAIGLAQLDKLQAFVEARRENFAYYFERLQPVADRIVLPVWDKLASPSWFGFPISAGDAAEAKALVAHLERALIETRKVFAGNILRQPGFLSVPHRVHDTLSTTDEIMDRAFFIGVYPGLTTEMREYVADTILAFFGAS